MDMVTLATRGSPLALCQANLVADSLRTAWPELSVNVLVVRTQGDVSTGPLDQIGGQGIFVTEVEQAVTDGRADIAVHSAKDLPSTMPEHLTLAAVPGRAPIHAMDWSDVAWPIFRRAASSRPARPVAGHNWRSCGQTSSSPTYGATWNVGSHAAKTARCRRSSWPWRPWNGWVGCIA